ncbi:hypothetical protein DH2020_029962 [Rehmannia glutinosa]|uniref:Thioredoxin domain-containing protein n=1 Tax=Rehmannia glutinosa TaxID=99300 RepID=A0ABR0VM27_REHGL
MVEFYAPWCGHCQALAPEYAAAAEELKDETVALAKVDATEEAELSQKFDVQGFPTVYFFVDGVHKPYPGQRTNFNDFDDMSIEDAAVFMLLAFHYLINSQIDTEDICRLMDRCYRCLVEEKDRSGFKNITTIEEAEHILADEDKIVLGYLESLVGSDSEELAAASSWKMMLPLPDNKSRCGKAFPHRSACQTSISGGEFAKSAIAEFVFENKLPLVTNFTRESAPLVFENPIKKQLILFATSNDSKKFYPVFLEAAKSFKGKLICVYVELDNEDVGKQVSEYFGVNGEAPSVLAYTGNDDARKFLLDSELTIDSIKNDGDVKIVVGDNFDEIVLDESKDVLLEIYAPWCGHCQSLEPIYNKLGKHLRGIDSLVIAKMDGTTNEHPRAKSDGFPTLLFFPAGNKSFDPITVETDRTVVAFYKFLKKHASIPFKLQKPEKHTASDTIASHEDSSSFNVKDEL